MQRLAFAHGAHVIQTYMNVHICSIYKCRHRMEESALAMKRARRLFQSQLNNETSEYNSTILFRLTEIQ